MLISYSPSIVKNVFVSTWPACLFHVQVNIFVSLEDLYFLVYFRWKAFLWRRWLCRRVGNGFEELGSAMRQIASPLALLDSGPPRPYSLFVSHRARSLLDTATKLNTRLQPDPWAHPLQMVTLIWKIIPLHRCTVAEIGGCSIFNRVCSCGQSVEIATLPWKIGNAHPNQPSNALHCELNQIAQIFHGQADFF